MKLSTTFFAFFAFPAFVTSIPFIDSINDGDAVATRGLNEQNIDKRDLSPEMFDIVTAISVYTDEFAHPRGYSRAEFTQNIVSSLRDRNPHFNYIICYTNHDYNFEGPWGVNVYNKWASYGDGTTFTNGPSYDVVIGKNGTFTKYGDGGFINWAYNGNVTSTEQGSHDSVVVTFGIPN